MLTSWIWSRSSTRGSGVAPLGSVTLKQGQFFGGIVLSVSCCSSLHDASICSLVRESCGVVLRLSSCTGTSPHTGAHFYPFPLASVQPLVPTLSPHHTRAGWNQARQECILGSAQLVFTHKAEHYSTRHFDITHALASPKNNLSEQPSVLTWPFEWDVDKYTYQFLSSDFLKSISLLCGYLHYFGLSIHFLGCNIIFI